jgi:hypothetical protein
VYLADKKSRQTPHKHKSEEGDAAVVELCVRSKRAGLARDSVHEKERTFLLDKACYGSGERG